MRRSSVLVGVALFVGGLAGVVVEAAPSRRAGGDEDLWLAEAAEHCDVPVGGANVVACLVERRDVLAPRVRAGVDVVAPAVAGWRSACARDLEGVCAEAWAGINLVECLRGHAPSLEAECRAQLEIPEANVMLACVTEAMFECAGIAPGGGRVVECLASHRPQLAEPCRSELAQIDGRVGAWREACGVEIDAHCRNATVGWPAAECLAAHSAQLRPRCEAKVTTAREVYDRLCATDVAALCPGVRAGAVLGCLQTHRAELGEACWNVVPSPHTPPA